LLTTAPRRRPPRRLTGVSAYALAIAAALLAGVVTRLTWPFFSLAPFAPLFLSVYVSVRWGSRAAGIVATLVSLAWTAWLAPDAPQFTLIPTTVFAVVAVLATHLITGRSEALEAAHLSEARAIRALEETTAAEARLRQAQKLEAIGQLVAGVAHNFNNLLTITMGYTDLLAEELSGDAKAHLTEIRRATDRGAKLTKQLLAITRKRDNAVTFVDVNAALRELEALLIPLIREDIELTIRRVGEPVMVLIDRQNFEQVLLNLVVNARDAVPKGGSILIEMGVTTVTSAEIPASFAAAPGDFVRVIVRDDGVGMAADVQAHLFEPFFTTKEVDKGTGLGLAFTYGVVRNAGGFITVTSAPGAGTTFAIHLPVADSASFGASFG
jgi:signal transduction histidine kinase